MCPHRHRYSTTRPLVLRIRESNIRTSCHIVIPNAAATSNGRRYLFLVHMYNTIHPTITLLLYVGNLVVNLQINAILPELGTDTPSEEYKI
jgi:hypothetical protein